MDERFIQQVIAELLDAQEQAFAVLAGAVGDATGRSALAEALDLRLARARAAAPHPIRDRLLTTALQSLRQAP